MERKEHALLDHLKAVFNVSSDGQLAKQINVGAPVISKIRGGWLPVTATTLLAMHEASGIGLRELRFLAGDFRVHTGKSAELLTADACAAMVASTELADIIRHARAGAGISTFRKTHSAAAAV